MATVAFTAFLPEVLPSVAGCADFTAQNAIKNAAIEFCEKTSFWQSVQDAETVAATDWPYQVPAPSGAKVSNVLSVRVDGVLVTPKTQSDMDSMSGDWRNQPGSPIHSIHLTADTFLLYPQPTVDVQLVVAAVYAPTRNSAVIDERVYQDHLDTIVSGALHRLLLIPGQTWSNPELATYHKEQFDSGVASARLDSFKSFSRAPIVIQPRRFG